jgi:hypothetical protein
MIKPILSKSCGLLLFLFQCFRRIGIKHLGSPLKAVERSFFFGGAGQPAGEPSAVLPEKVVRWVGTFFSGVLVPVIPLLQRPFETSERSLRTDVLLNQKSEKWRQ